MLIPIMIYIHSVTIKITTIYQLHWYDICNQLSVYMA
jgi:Na+-transporting NADH:ubiquinone oxidoreductase subunit NqrD